MNTKTLRPTGDNLEILSIGQILEKGLFTAVLEGTIPDFTNKPLCCKTQRSELLDPPFLPQKSLPP